MEFRGQEPVDEMGIGIGPAPPLAYGAVVPRAHAPSSAASSSGNGAGAAPAGAGVAVAPQQHEVRYHQCLRNHAAAMGGHVVDGCGEFMPGDEDDALKCAACGCHRSFHRKDDGQQRRLLLPAPAPAPTTARVPLLLPPAHPYAAASHPHAPPFLYHHRRHHTLSGSGGTTTESSSEERGPPSALAAQGHVRRKRFRTRFTPEQKEQMLAFAERVGWRMQKQDEALVEQFCAQVGVRRQVFKVWMHNNKQHSSSGRRQQPQQEQHPQQQQPQQQQQ